MVRFQVEETGNWTGLNEVKDMEIGRADLTVIVKDQTLKLKIWHSKCDQEWNGAVVFIKENDKVYSAARWMAHWSALTSCEPEEPVFPICKACIARIVKSRLQSIGLSESDLKCYSSHSLRRGGATAAARQGVPDSTIKKHGRWKSTCFMIYTDLERREAGFNISSMI